MCIVKPVLTCNTLHHKRMTRRSILSWGLLTVAINIKKRIIVDIQIILMIFLIVKLTRKWHVRVAAIASKKRFTVKLNYVVTFMASDHASEAKPMRFDFCG